ncbi:TTAGGG repeat binding factor, partial [Rhizina undulata]
MATLNLDTKINRRQPLQIQEQRSRDSQQDATRVRPSHPAKPSSSWIVKKTTQYFSPQDKLTAFQIRLVRDLDVVLKTPPPPGSIPTFRSIIESTEKDPNNDEALPSPNLHKKVNRPQPRQVKKRRFINPQPGATRVSPFDTSDELRETPKDGVRRKRKLLDLQPRPTNQDPFDSVEPREPQSEGTRKKRRFFDRQPGPRRQSPFDFSDQLSETPPPLRVQRKRKISNFQQRPTSPNPFFNSVEPRESQPDGIRTKRRFIDPQPGAIRVSPFNTSDELRETPPDGIRKKHRRVQLQPAAASSSCVAKLPGSGKRPSSKRLSSIETDAILMELHPEYRGCAKRGDNIGKTNRGEHVSGKKKQSRKFWTSEAEDLLVDKIGELGCQWSAIRDLREPLFHGRTNVQLKDKARILKFNFL